MSLNTRIKERREQLNLSRIELAEKIGVTPSAIANYENGISSPKVELLYKLFDALECDANYLYQDETKKLTYRDKATPEEFENIVKKYRSLDPFGQETVSIVLNRESERMKTISQHVDRIAELEPMLAQSATTIRMYAYMNKIASAGGSFYFEDIPTDTIEAPYCKGADFIIGVNGDSMEPDYHDGDKLYIQKAKDLSLGDVGIFTVWNECFVKELGERGLISKNPTYDDIPGTEDVRLIGRVLGKVETD